MRSSLCGIAISSLVDTLAGDVFWDEGEYSDESAEVLYLVLNVLLVLRESAREATAYLKRLRLVVDERPTSFDCSSVMVYVVRGALYYCAILYQNPAFQDRWQFCYIAET